MTAREIVEAMAEKGLTLATAESLTGGLVSAQICGVSGASKCFLGGVCAYQDEIKGNILSVLAKTLDEFTAVSAPCAREMARGAKELFHADYALSTTGYAGPTGDDVGLVYIGLSGPNGEKAHRLRLSGSRQGIRHITAQIALYLLKKEIDQHGQESKR
ncbi:MAG: CinA family protein [Clostridiales bacterium]|nr:CinA family protein [Clostridiales bacterium]